jgi:predicted nucleotidyltransferase
MAQLRTRSDELVSETMLDEMTRRIVAKCHPLRVILFGSYASGTATPDSDVDLLVVVETATSTRELSLDLRMALRDLRVGKDIIVATQQTIEQFGQLLGTIYREALITGRTLYARQ